MNEEQVCPFTVQHHRGRINVVAILLRLYLYGKILSVGKGEPGSVKVFLHLSRVPVYVEVRCHAVFHEAVFLMIEHKYVPFDLKGVHDALLRKPEGEIAVLIKGRLPVKGNISAMPRLFEAVIIIIGIIKGRHLAGILGLRGLPEIKVFGIRVAVCVS